MRDDLFRAEEDLLRALSAPSPLSAAFRQRVLDAGLRARGEQIGNRRAFVFTWAAACLLTIAAWRNPPATHGNVTARIAGRPNSGSDGMSPSGADFGTESETLIAGSRLTEWDLVEAATRIRERNSRILLNAFRRTGGEIDGRCSEAA